MRFSWFSDTWFFMIPENALKIQWDKYSYMRQYYTSVVGSANYHAMCVFKVSAFDSDAQLSITAWV